MISKFIDANKKIENTVVGSYVKIEDAFVERYLKRDGETTAEAKARIKNEIERKPRG